MNATPDEIHDDLNLPRQQRKFNPFIKKPLWVVLKKEGNISSNNDDREEEENTRQQINLNPPPPRHLSLFDLVSIGVGGTIGSGIFVLNGLIAHNYAGPATFLSWLLSGSAALLSGCCYAELSGRIPVTGSSYLYAYVALGELPAFVTAGMVSLEFLLSGSAVARSWGDKVVMWLRVNLNVSESVLQYLEPGYGINPIACLISIVTTILVMKGIKESKLITDIFTWVKVMLVIFMVIGGFVLFDRSNFVPFIPPEYGVSGIMRGAVSSFFGYLGFDAMCCVAGEAKNAERNLPLSIMITLAIVTTLYVSAAISLVGMQNYQEISPESGFPVAFKSNGIDWASQLTAFGEVMTLPVVVLICIVIQPRLQYALAMDGLLPAVFGETDATGNTVKGALIAGALMTIFATFVPFSYLDDFVSAGILMAFTITNCSLIIMRRRSPESEPHLLQKNLAWYNIFAFSTCMSISHIKVKAIRWGIGSILGLLSLLISIRISIKCPAMTLFGNATSNTLFSDKQYFSTPFMPYIPCLGIFVNYFLISQLEFLGIFLLLAYILLFVLLYFLYGARNSVGRGEGWKEQDYFLISMSRSKDNEVELQGIIT